MKLAASVSGEGRARRSKSTPRTAGRRGIIGECVDGSSSRGSASAWRAAGRWACRTATAAPATARRGATGAADAQAARHRASAGARYAATVNGAAPPALPIACRSPSSSRPSAPSSRRAAPRASRSSARASLKTCAAPSPRAAAMRPRLRRSSRTTKRSALRRARARPVPGCRAAYAIRRRATQIPATADDAVGRVARGAIERAREPQNTASACTPAKMPWSTVLLDGRSYSCQFPSHPPTAENANCGCTQYRTPGPSLTPMSSLPTGAPKS